MPGIACQFKILDLTIARIAGASDLNAIHEVISAYPEYAYLGAVGPALADFIPGNTARNPYLHIWSEVFSLIGDDMRVDKGLLSVVRDIRDLLNQLDPIVVNEDISALMDMEDQLGSITDVGDQLQAIFDQIPSIILPIGAGITADMRPEVNVSVNSIVPPNNSWKLRNFLFWKKTGDFVKTLLKNAQDDRFLAYAYGYLVSYAANVTGSPFIDSIIGGPYRTQWWRYRWVNNYIDAWVYGNYESGAIMHDDTPTPPYYQWKSLCDADLHTKIALAEHDPADLMRRLYAGEPLADTTTLPESFCRFWIDAFNETYNNPSAPVGDLSLGDLNDAYLMTWLILWFQTGSDGIGCNIPPSMTPPEGCGGEPPWVKPEVSDSGGSVSVPTPPEPEIETDPDVGKIISGIILALLGLGALATGNLTAGGAAIAGGINLIIEGATEIDWDKLRCDLHWYRFYLYYAMSALHEILSVAAFRHPRAEELAHDTTMSEYFSTFVEPYDSGKAVTKSRISTTRTQDFPARPWTGGFDWMNRPNTGIEWPPTTAYMIEAYPSFFVDDAVSNPLSNGEVRVAGTWPCRETTGPFAGIASITVPVQFGNAVDNILDLFRHLDGDFPNWNLDADRGLAYHTWKFLNDLYLDPVAIDHED